MRDGVILRSDIYRPVTDKPVPALLTRGPYDKRIMSGSLVGLDTRAATAAGYAVVAQDVRGRFASDGQFKLTPTQSVEGPDGYDTIEWIAAQPWCSGAVGMFGASYVSLTQWMAASERPPSLRAIIPERTGSPPRGALLLDSILITWAASQALDWLQKAMLRQEAGEKEAQIIKKVLMDPHSAARQLPLNDSPLMQIGGLPSLQEMIRTLHAQSLPDAGLIDIPVLISSGWFDMATPETIDLYERLLRRPPRDGAAAEVSILFGPWDHGGFGMGLGEKSFGPLAATRMALIPQLYLDFYDRHLKGDSSKKIPGARYFMMGANEWRSASAWPPLNEETSFFLHSGGQANSVSGDGRLSRAISSPNSPADRYLYDPLEPVPSFGGRYFEWGGSRAGPYDQRRVEQRRDVLVYTGERLEQSLEIAGSVRLELFVACSTVDTDFTAKLCDVDLDGISRNILDEFFRCRWRDGYDKISLLAPGEVYAFEIDMGPVAHRFAAGHRIRLQVTSSAFPAYDRNMNTGHEIGVDAEGPVAEITLFHDESRRSRVILPICSGE
ncbi:MAG: CocE/NonD family hydrolase [Caulobacteraceae bacterium]